MTGLLVSVRNATEAQIALESGADLIDVKEPDRGALGAADTQTINEVIEMVSGRLPVSVALGELVSLERNAHVHVTEAVGFAKLGLAGCGATENWPQRWKSILDRLPRQTRKVAVAYADWESANAPTPESIITYGVDNGCTAVLLDTFDKSRGSLLEWLSESDLRYLLGLARDHEMTTVVAGSLNESTIPNLLPLEPDFVAVRGAACESGRTSTVNHRRVERLARTIHAGPIRPTTAPF